MSEQSLTRREFLGVAVRAVVLHIDDQKRGLVRLDRHFSAAWSRHGTNSTGTFHGSAARPQCLFPALARAAAV